MVTSSQIWETEIWGGLGCCLRSQSWPVALPEHTVSDNKKSVILDSALEGQFGDPQTPSITGSCVSHLVVSNSLRPHGL